MKLNSTCAQTFLMLKSNAQKWKEYIEKMKLSGRFDAYRVKDKAKKKPKGFSQCGPLKDKLLKKRREQDRFRQAKRRLLRKIICSTPVPTKSTEVSNSPAYRCSFTSTFS